MNDEKHLEDVINSMSASNIPVNTIDNTEVSYDETETLNRALQEISDLIDANKDVIEETRQLIKTTADVTFIEAFSNISRSQSDNLKNLVKLITEKEKNKTVKTVKEQEIRVKEKLIDAQVKELEGKASALPAGSTLNQTNVVVTGSPDEALRYLKRLKEGGNGEKTIDITEQ